MAASVATHSHTTQLLIADGSAGAYVKIAEVTAINGVKITVGKTQTTHLESDDAFHERIPGLGDADDVTIEANYTELELERLYALVRVQQSFRITFPDSSTWDWDGFLVELGTEVPLDDKINMSAAFAVSGKPVFAQV